MGQALAVVHLRSPGTVTCFRSLGACSLVAKIVAFLRVLAGSAPGSPRFFR